MTRVVFLLVPRLHLLDLAGPAQVFSTAADLGLRYRLRYVAEHDEVPTAQGVPLRAEPDWPALAPDDLVVVPGLARRRRAARPAVAADAARRSPPTTRPAERSPASARAPTRSARPGCSTAGAAPPTTTLQDELAAALPAGDAWCATCCTSTTTG